MHALPHWRLSGYYFFYFAFIGAFSPYFGLYLQSLSFSAWDIGLLMSQMQLMRLFGPNLWGWLVDHFGHRLVVIRLAGAVGLAGFLAFFWLDRLPGMLVAMAVLALFWSAALPLVETLTFDHLREERRGAVREPEVRVVVREALGSSVRTVLHGCREVTVRARTDLRGGPRHDRGAAAGAGAAPPQRSRGGRATRTASRGDRR